MSLVLAALAFATTGYADLDAIDRTVQSFAGGDAITVAPVDRRLRLAPCSAPLALSWRTPAHDSVLVQCIDPGGWRLFVAVRATAGGAGAAVVSRGDAVSISVSGEGFSVAQPGAALEAGAIGAWIRVRPAGARRGDETMRAQVVRPGLVSVPLP